MEKERIINYIDEQAFLGTFHASFLREPVKQLKEKLKDNKAWYEFMDEYDIGGEG